jgi:phosphoribosyl 1,2-cyclic phosphodiesterase/CheY-like chemotaxis protein
MSQALAKTALIIDDDSDYRALMVELLRGNGWEVLAASEGEEGIALAKEHRPEVVLCDLLMPRCNGFQVCRALRREESLRNIKILVTSGRQFGSDLQSAREAGADEYLTKPVDTGQLMLLMSRLAEGARKAEQQQEETAATPPPPMLIKFWGVRGSIPTPGPNTVEYGGNTSCVEVRSDGQILILDAGSGMRLLGRSLSEEFGNQPLDLVVLLTHTHWDHIQGFPFFQPVYRPQSRLRILGYEGVRHSLANVLNSQMESPFFPIRLREVPANVTIEEIKDMTFRVGSVLVQACFANHPGICVGYRVSGTNGSVAFFPDNEPYIRGARLSSRQDSAGSSDTQFVKNENSKLINFIRGVDVLIMDAQYDRVEYQRHLGWGHGCLDDVVCLALDADVKQLYLFHHDPDHDDAKITSMVEYARRLVEARNGTMRVEAAKEGYRVELAAPAAEPLPPA